MADRGSSPKPKLPTSLPLWFPAAPHSPSEGTAASLLLLPHCRAKRHHGANDSTQAKTYVIGRSLTLKILCSLLTQRAVD